MTVLKPRKSLNKNWFRIKSNHSESIDTKGDTPSLEQEIDQLACELYGLTEEEIAIVEGGVK